MKTIITLLAATTVIAGASSAMAFDRQATDDAMTSANSVQVTRDFGGAYASARVLRGNSTVTSRDDRQLVGTR
jgi:hypothetical protein